MVCCTSAQDKGRHEGKENTGHKNGGSEKEMY